jgi:hypothetical protein
LKAMIGRQQWLWRILDFINPLRDPSLTVAAVLTFIEEAGQRDTWYWIIVIGLVNWLAVRGIVWLVVNFTFASTFLLRRLWWAMQHPRLAWRILDAIGHEEIVIGGLPSLPEGVILPMPDGNTLMNPTALGTGGIQVIGELPAGAEVSMLGMATGKLAALNGPNATFPVVAPGLIPQTNTGTRSGMNGASAHQHGSNGFMGQRTTDGLPSAFSPSPSAEEERLRQQLAAYSRLLDDWIQFTEEKWRTISDSQLGWKPLRGRWSGWEDIFQDAYAAKTSDPMSKAAQKAGEVTARRFDFSKEKGSAASAVACFLRDMMTLRQGLDMMQSSSPEEAPETPTQQTAVRPSQYAAGSGLLKRSSPYPRKTLIRQPTQIFVDADKGT